MPYDYYTKDYEKGLSLYANGVLIMEKCADACEHVADTVGSVIMKNS